MIIPCYNAEAFVQDAVLSVVEQRVPRVSCVVVDDGSTDGSAQRVLSLRHKDVVLIRTVNQGAARARNTGFQASDSELVMFLDADDILTKGTLADRIEAFRCDPKLEMLVGQNLVQDIDSGECHVSPTTCGEDYLTSCLLMRKELPHSNVITFRREALAKVGLYEEGLSIAEDMVLWVKAWATLRWRFVPQIQAIQRTGSFVSLSRRHGKLFFYEQVGEGLRRVRPFLRQRLQSDLPWRRAYSRYACDFAVWQLKHSKYLPAARWAAVAIATAPTVAERRAYAVLLEALLPRKVFLVARNVARVVGLRVWGGEIAER